MPIFALIPLGQVILAWVTSALAAYGAHRLYSENSIQDLVGMVEAWVVAEVARRAGLQLDPDAPFSDASFAGAISERVGFPVRTLKDKAKILEDVEDFAVGRVSEKLGFAVRSLRDPVMLRQDFEAAALVMVAQKTGIPIAPLEVGQNLDVESIKAQVEEWARARISLQMADSQAAALAAMQSPGTDFEALAISLNARLEAVGAGDRVTAGKLALRVAENLVSESAANVQRVAMNATKRTRRQVQLRDAQQKFRKAHGNRQKYVPLGMVASIGAGP